MRENGARLTSKNANFGGFAVLWNPIIDPLQRDCAASGSMITCERNLSCYLSFWISFVI